jgi:peptidyl-dipeptidase Dcp
LAKADGIDEMQSYDHAFYAENFVKQKFDLNDEELKPYFPLNQVQDAVFGLAGQLFGLTFEERNDIPKYHEDVKVYEVKENGIINLYYM